VTLQSQRLQTMEQARAFLEGSGAVDCRHADGVDEDECQYRSKTPRKGRSKNPRAVRCAGTDARFRSRVERTTLGLRKVHGVLDSTSARMP